MKKQTNVRRNSRQIKKLLNKNIVPFNKFFYVISAEGLLIDDENIARNSLHIFNTGHTLLVPILSELFKCLNKNYVKRITTFNEIKEVLQ